MIIPGRFLYPQLAIIILTTYRENDLMRRGLAAGALGYLLKDTDRETLIATIQAAARGEALLQPEILHQALRSKEKNEAFQLAEQDILTERETEVLDMVADGARNKEIAYKLKITERTVKAHLSHIYQKLAVDSRAAAVAEAAKRGWL
jgi:NarL family two-component system response regulator YdfI